MLPDVLARVERKDLPWERWYDLSAQELGELIRAPKMGKTLHRLVHTFPRLELAAHVQPITRAVLKVDLSITPDFAWDEKAHGYVLPFWVFVEDADGEALLHAQYWVLKSVHAEDEHSLSFTVPIAEPLPPQYFVRVVSDTWLGCEAVLPVSFRHLILPEKFAPPTELLDLQPLPVSALRSHAAATLYPGFATFNPIQTQVFAAAYNSDDAMLLCAPAGSGKTAVAEFALLRAHARAASGAGPALRCVVIEPNAASAKVLADDWRARVGPALGISVAELTGESAADVKLLERNEVVVSTPERFDALSRRWKQRKAVQAVSLLIADELHMVGGPGGPAYEVVVSRMRYMASTLGTPLRVVGLAASVANARDLGEWLGAGAGGVFAFPPGARPLPLEVHVQAFDIANLEARMRAMARPAYGAVLAHAPRGAPALLFVPTRRHARLAALDLLTYAAADGEPTRFLHAAPDDVAPFLTAVADASLRHALSYGVGFVYDGQPVAERRAVDALFGSGAVQVVVATAATAWGLTLRARAVVVMGTQAYDALGATGGSDYAVADLLQMLGRAGRPGADDGARAVLMCHAPRKEYYKKFLFDPLPVESHLDAALHDHLAAEVVTRVVASKQDAVDYLTWTLFYRRLAQNPNYYGLAGVSHRHLSDHLSDLVEGVVADLEAGRVLAVEADVELEPLNLGMIAAFYYVTYTTIELLASSLGPKTKMRGLLDIVAAASEFGSLPQRPGDDEAVRRLLAHAHLPPPSTKWADPHVKAHALLQAHFSRSPLGGALAADRDVVVPKASRLLHAAVDVAASSGWLGPALAAMELAQMVAQGVWDRDSPLLFRAYAAGDPLEPDTFGVPSPTACYRSWACPARGRYVQAVKAAGNVSAKEALGTLADRWCHKHSTPMAMAWPKSRRRSWKT